MWLLKDSNGNIRYLKPNNIIHIGRKQTDIVLENDSSISRIHAVINVIIKNEIKISEESSKIIIKDANSKYGTSIIRNGIQIKVSNEGLKLQHNDMIKFGLQYHIFRVEYIHFVTVISRLSSDHKKQLKNIMDSIGGIIIDYYNDYCTHLTATTATSTNKIISAIISGIPIISINYWISVLNAIEINDNLPDPISFTLPLQDKGINSKHVSLKPNSYRKTIFQGKIFIFFSEKMYEEYKKIIKEAGGKSELYTKNLENISENLFADNKLIMQLTDDCITDYLEKFNATLYEKLQKKNLRMIAETEILLAIIYVSLDQFCNPNYHFKDLMKRKSFKKDISQILALDTQNNSICVPNTFNVDLISEKVHISETYDFSQESVAQIKNKILFKSVMKAKDISSNIVNIGNQNSQMCIIKSDNLNFTTNNAEKLENFNSNYSTFSKSELSTRKIEIDNNIFKDTNYDLNINKVCLLNLKTKKQNQRLKISNETMRPENAVVCNENISHNNFEKSINKQNLDFLLQEVENVLTVNKNLTSKNIQCEKSEFNEINKHKINKHDILEPEQDKNKIKKRKESKINKWGFKKYEKKAIDFDLDDMDKDELKVEINTLEYLSGLNEKSTKPTEKKNQNEKLFYFNKNNENDRIIDVKSFGIFNESIKDSIFDGPSKIKNFSENNISVKNKINKFLLGSNIILGSSTNNKIGSKVFKKAYNQIPINRIILSNMTVWKSNT